MVQSIPRIFEYDALNIKSCSEGSNMFFVHDEMSMMWLDIIIIIIQIQHLMH